MRRKYPRFTESANFTAAPEASVHIAGSLAQKPRQGGHTWQFLNYLLGFKQLGWDVLFVDRIEPAMCTDASGAAVKFADSVNLGYFLLSLIHI